jgi:hypothetical protein
LILERKKKQKNGFTAELRKQGRGNPILPASSYGSCSKLKRMKETGFL